VKYHADSSSRVIAGASWHLSPLAATYFIKSRLGYFLRNFRNRTVLGWQVGEFPDKIEKREN
jgi:hypothetical protein